jgi:hypothetical protein
MTFSNPFTNSADLKGYLNIQSFIVKDKVGF